MDFFFLTFAVFDKTVSEFMCVVSPKVYPQGSEDKEAGSLQNSSSKDGW